MDRGCENNVGNHHRSVRAHGIGRYDTIEVRARGRLQHGVSTCFQSLDQADMSCCRASRTRCNIASHKTGRIKAQCMKSQNGQTAGTALFGDSNIERSCGAERCRAMHEKQVTYARNHDEESTTSSATIQETRLSLAPARCYESLAPDNAKRTVHVEDGHVCEPVAWESSLRTDAGATAGMVVEKCLSILWHKTQTRRRARGGQHHTPLSRPTSNLPPRPSSETRSGGSERKPKPRCRCRA